METRRSQRIEPMQKCSYGDSDAKSHAYKNINKNLNNTNSCKVISKLLLPEDLMIDIFTLVPLTCLFNSARYVCKSWAATIRSSQFTEACERRRCSKPGLYVENWRTHGNSYFLEFKDDDVIGQFERTDLGTLQRMGHVVSTCDGILLLSKGHSTTLRETFVANPILKCWLRIPPLPSSQYRVFEIQLIIARIPHTAVFKLFHVNILEISGAFWYVFYALRIGIDNSWKEIARKESPCWEILGRQFCNGGNDIYWIAKKEVIVIDVDKEVILREYPLPHLPNYPATKYLLMGNRLSCIASKDFSNTAYQIYILDFHSGKWSIYHEMGHFDYVAACGHEHVIIDVIFRFWIDDQIIFGVTLNDINTKKIHFGYNVKTKQLTKIEDIDVGDFEVWLHTNSLVTLPSSPA